MPKVFIVGAPRTGTSLLLFALKDVFKLPGHGESHVIPLFQRLIHWQRQYLSELSKGPATLLIRKFPGRELEDVVCEFARKFYDTQFPEGSWVDKTPTGEAVHGIPLIKRIFPDARIILTMRNGIEVVRSHAKKFNVSVEDACSAWISAMKGLENYGVDSQVLIVDQFDFVMNSDDVAARICAHIGDESKVAALSAYLKEKRVESFTERDWTKRMTLQDTGWSNAEKSHFQQVCGPLMIKLGYEMG